MRKSLVNLIKISQEAKNILAGNLSKRIVLRTKGNNEVNQIADSFNQIVQQLEHNIIELKKSKEALQKVLIKVSSGVSFTENIDSFLDLILETTVHALDGYTGLLLIRDENNNDLVIKSVYGLDIAPPSNKMFSPEEEPIKSVMELKKPLLISYLDKTSRLETQSKYFKPPLICAPLIFQNKILGIISISGKKQKVDFQENESVVLYSLASQIAMAIENARLNSDNQKAYLDTITALALAVEARDVYSRGHSDRVSEYAVKVAKKLNLDEHTIKTIKEAAQLHDVGKIGISDEILRKPDLLNDFEKSIMEDHPVIGEGIIIPLHGFSHLRNPIRHHHEWLNGEGYPDHLKGNEIPLEAQILATADAFDAMTTDRPYRKGMTYQEAKEELTKYKDIRYRPEIIDALVSCL
jgi:HAMP domain-containing protein